jgi:hypothetical protein
MSFSGQSPSAKRIRYTPQSVDPVNPAEGDFFFSDGTPRIAGPWVYQGGAWQQVQTSGALSTVNDLTFLPQASDPTPATGKVFYADGTSRAEGLWIYDGSQWVQLSGNNRTQEFYFKSYYQVSVASIGVNIPLTNVFANGSNAIDSVTLVVGDLVLLKDQAVDSENGVYLVGVSGPPVRATGTTTFGDLNNFAAIVNEGTVNKNTTWFQNIVLTSFSGQDWSATPEAKTFVVPADITTIAVTGCGGGGGGGGGGGVPTTGAAVHGGGGGAGGCGATVISTNISVTPGETISVTLGDGGSRALGQFVSGATAPSGGGGGQTEISCLSGTYRFPGADGGAGGVCFTGLNGGGAGGVGIAGNNQDIAAPIASRGGNGSAGSGSNIGGGPTSLSGTGQTSIASNGGLGTTGFRGGNGGGGGASINIGGAGGVGVAGGYTTISTPTSVNCGQEGSRGSGGGGGGGTGANAGGGNRTGFTSGAGGPGYVRISW